MANNALNTFYQEANELLLTLEDSLLIMEKNPHGKDAMNCAFRSIHTIKGSSGMFGLEHIECFAHHVEQLLDCVRHGDISLDENVIALLLTCKDHLENLVKAVVLSNELNPDLKTMSSELSEKINTIVPTELFKSAPDQNQPEHFVEPTENTTLAETGGNHNSVTNPNWHISIRFAEDILNKGMDPVSILKYLANYGSLENVTTLWNKLPRLQDLDPGTCYPALEIELNSNSGRDEIETAFQFIQDDCTVYLVAPHADISLYASLLKYLPESSSELVSIFTECGSLTVDEANAALSAKPSSEDVIKIGYRPEPSSTRAVTSTSADNVNNDDIQAKNADLSGDHGKLDSLINLVGELVISGATTHLLAQQVGNEDLLESISRMGRLIEDIRDSVLSRRMVPIEKLFSQFQPVINAINQSKDKSVSLELHGTNTEMEIAMFGKTVGPLSMLVKSIIETMENNQARIEANLEPAGLLALDAYHDSGSIVIEFLNDGNCLPITELTEYAVSKSLIEKDANIIDSEIYRLLLENKISTNSLDDRIASHLQTLKQVKNNIEALRGTLEIDSVDERSALIRIRLPLTLAIIDGFLVGVGKSCYVVPLDMVLECVELEQVEEHMDKSQSYINLRGEVLPFLRLRELFHESKEQNVRENIVVVEYGGVKAGLVVDALLGEVQTVIKPLGKILQNLKGICGATILGSGNVAVIIDVPNLIQKATFATDLKNEHGNSIH